MLANCSNRPPSGLVVLHANRQEILKDLLVEWIKKHPLSPLVNETLLVQSNGIGQWLKLALAEDVSAGGAGIAANIDLKLPAMFLWQAYRGVLGAEQVPRTSPYDKPRLTWRLMRILNALPETSVFQPLHQFIAQGDAQKRRFQLAERLADLYDQYQIYRTDWLNEWAQDKDQITNAQGQPHSLDSDQRWQAELWRAIREDLGSEAQSCRVDLHQKFIERCNNPDQSSQSLPPRVIIFGVSALPAQMLEALSALSEKMQVLLCVLNPCRHYWADIIDGRELLRRERKRQALKPNFPEHLDDQSMHLYANPLLAAWGKQGRDYLNLLDQIDQSEQYRDRFELSTINLFDDPETLPSTLLGQIQRQILELEPNNKGAVLLSDTDYSLRFTGAHSAQREVEILHDQLLDALAQDPSLMPRDILVMVPNIDDYRAQIEAVFSLVGSQDKRFIPFSLSDQSAKARIPLLTGLEFLLNLKQSRLLISELLDLLELPAVQKRFELTPQSIPILSSWIRDAGIRWGLNDQHRTHFGLALGMNQNAWLSGLARMLLGYVNGERQSFDGIEPFADVRGFDANAVGGLAELLHRLENWLKLLEAPCSVTQWRDRLLNLLAQFFDRERAEDALILGQLERQLRLIVEQAEEANLEESLDIEILAKTWLDAVDQPDLSQRFIAGGLTFATLMPMRAIPYRRIYLLGMNDGVYPRSQIPSDMDLMALAGHYRPGDRSRREDDRYLFLEALLSARDHLSISWISHSERDNAEQPPSVLVSQLRDHIKQGWKHRDAEVLNALTTYHPLQPFSERYFQPDSQLFTYAQEWREIHQKLETRIPQVSANLAASAAQAIDIRELATFLRRPVAYYYQSTLGVRFLRPDQIPPEHESFQFNGLDRFRIGDQLLERIATVRPEERQTQLKSELARLEHSGEMPWGGFAAREARQLLSTVSSALNHLDWCVEQSESAIEPATLSITHLGIELSGRIDNLYGGMSVCRAKPTVSATIEKGDPRVDRIVSYWPAHLLACLNYDAFTTRLAGPDKILQIDSVPPNEALRLLAELLSLRDEALKRPLPIAVKTAFVLLQSGADKARKEFEGDQYKRGERDKEDELRAHWGDFDQLVEAGLQDYAQRLYAPIIQYTRIWIRGDE